MIFIITNSNANEKIHRKYLMEMLLERKIPFKSFVVHKFLSIVKTLIFLAKRKSKSPNVNFHLFTPFVIAIFGLFCRVLGCKYCCHFTGLGFFVHRSRLLGPVVYSFIIRIAKGADYWVVQNLSDGAYLVAKGLDPAKMRLVGFGGHTKKPSGVGLVTSTTSPLPPTDHNKLQVQQVISFVYVGRTLKDKGFSDYVELATKFRGQSGVTFSLIGAVDGGRRGIDENRLNRSGINKLGQMDDVVRHLAAFHYIVLPSLGEGAPRVIFEARTVGVPVIAYPATGLTEHISPFVNGILTDALSVDALCDAVAKCKALGLSYHALLRQGCFVTMLADIRPSGMNALVDEISV